MWLPVQKQSPEVHTDMIRKNLINCNLIRAKSSTKSLFDSCKESFNIHEEECPHCHRKGDCHVHAYYHRYAIDFIKGRPLTHRLKILRVKCSCGQTHAILPDPIIPYSSYSLFFILHVLAAYFTHSRTISAICDRFCISPMQLYRWKSLYQEHRREWQGLLKSVEQDLLDSLKELISLDPFSTFARDFFAKTSMTFMQSHKNPTSCPRSPSPS